MSEYVKAEPVAWRSRNDDLPMYHFSTFEPLPGAFREVEPIYSAVAFALRDARIAELEDEIARIVGASLDHSMAAARSDNEARRWEARAIKAEAVLRDIIEECHNGGYPNQIVATRMIERIEETALMALAEIPEPRVNDGDHIAWAVSDDVLGSISVAKSWIDAALSAPMPDRREITMQDVRLAVGEGPLKPADVLAGCNAEMRRRGLIA